MRLTKRKENFESVLHILHVRELLTDDYIKYNLYVEKCLNRLQQYEDLFEQMDKETFGLMEMVNITDKIIEIGKGE